MRGLLRSRREERALTEAKRCVELHPTSAAAAVSYGRCLLRRGKSEEGMQQMKEAAAAGPAAGPDGAWGHSQGAHCLRAYRKADRCKRKGDDAYVRGRFSDGAACYTEGIRILLQDLPDDKWGRAQMYAARAACHRRDRQLVKALEDCEAAIALCPRYPRALFRRAACLLEMAKPKEATTAFEALLGVDREWPHLLDWLIRAHALEKRQEKEGTGWGFSNFEDDAKQEEAAGPDSSVPDGELPDHYTLLGVPVDATDKQLKRAYRLMSLKYHPDRSGGSTAAFQRVATAYETLSDMDKRRSKIQSYDPSPWHWSGRRGVSCVVCRVWRGVLCVALGVALCAWRCVRGSMRDVVCCVRRGVFCRVFCIVYGICAPLPVSPSSD